VLHKGLRSEVDVARALRMSPATLRRRLAEAGPSFRAVLDDVQRVAAAALLMTDKPFEDIASEVQYSDARSFRRACHRWFGMTPSAYRQSQTSAVTAARH
jgi:AraC-like DNA-binding protein